MEGRPEGPAVRDTHFEQLLQRVPVLWLDRCSNAACGFSNVTDPDFDSVDISMKATGFFRLVPPLSVSITAMTCVCNRNPAFL